MKITKNPLLVLASSSLVLTAPATILACTNSAEPPVVASQWQQEVDQAFANQNLTLQWQEPIITRALYDQFKSQPAALKPALTLSGALAFRDFTITALEETPTGTTFTLQITNDQNEMASQRVDLPHSFSTDATYVDGVYEQLAAKLQLKEQFQTIRLDALLAQLNTLDQLTSVFDLPSFLGIETTLKIPSQNIELDDLGQSQLKVNFVVRLNGQVAVPSSPVQRYFHFAQAQSTTATILLQSDLNQAHLNGELRAGHFGFTKILANQGNQNLVIKTNFAQKRIVGSLDFSYWQTIDFAGADFSANQINQIKFSPMATINNLNTNLFTNNALTEVVLPQVGSNFHIGAFDANVTIANLAQVPALKQIYEPSTHTLSLQRLTDPNQIESAFQLVAAAQGGDFKTINVDTIILPSFSFNSPYGYKVITKTITFNSEVNRAQKIENFTTNLASWTIARVNIPASVLLINPLNLPSAARITRHFSADVLNLITNNSLNLDQELPPLQQFNLKPQLISNLDKLDHIFYGFATPQLDPKLKTLKTITTASTHVSSSAYNLADSLKFFTSQSTATGKQFCFQVAVQKLDLANFNQLRSALAAAKVTIVRQINQNWLTGTTLDLEKFQTAGANYQNLIGAESLVTTITPGNLTTINSALLQDLHFNNVTLDLAKITTVGERAFTNSTLQFTNANQMTTIGVAAFQNTELDQVSFKNPAAIGANAFDGTKLTSVDLSNAKEIAAAAFANNSRLATVTWNSALTTISSSCFSNTPQLSSFNFNGVNTIEERAFQGSGLAGVLDLKTVNSIGAGAFGNTQITTLTLNPAAVIGAGAFMNATLTSVTGLNLETVNIAEVFGSYFARINFAEDQQDLETLFGYNSATKDLDLSPIRNWQDQVIVNKWNLFIAKHRDFNRVTLPPTNLPATLTETLFNQNINELTWAAFNNKVINFTLSSKTNIKKLNQDFLVGAESVPAYFVANTDLGIATTLNLVNIKSVADYAFQTMRPIKFVNTMQINQIGDQSFRNDVVLQLGTNVQLQDQSFSGNLAQPATLIPAGVTFTKRFNEFYSRIYDPLTKTLDFTKASVTNGANDKSKWGAYLNIGKYLVTGEVRHLVLPKVTILWNEFVDHLGAVETIEFNAYIQVLAANAFTNTNVTVRPNQNQTNVLVDLANFFSNKPDAS